MHTKKIYLISLCFLVFGATILMADSDPDKKEQAPLEPVPEIKLTLKEASTCEDLKNSKPWNEAVVFSLKNGKVTCYCSFDPVPEKTFIQHRWFHKDRLNARRKLILKPPRWSTFSTIQMREDDKGPWRVEIMGPDGKVFQTLRFSITD